MAGSQNPDKDKVGYPTLALALKAKSGVAKSKGARFRKLRVYRRGDRWFLTKMTADTFGHIKRKFRKRGYDPDNDLP